jgi:ATP-binding cassette subfamily B protein
MTMRLRAFQKLGKGFALGRRLASALRPHAAGETGALAGAAGLTVLVLALRMAQPWPLKWVMDLVSGQEVRIAGWEGTLGLFAAAYLAASLGAALADYGLQRTVVGVVNRVVYAFRHRLFRHVLRLPMAYHEKKEVGELLTRVVPDVARLRRGLAGLFLRGARSVLLFLATVAVLLWIDPALAAVVLAGGLAAGALMLFRGRLILRAARRGRRREGKLASVVEESLQSIRELQTYRTEAPPDPRFEAQHRKSLGSEQKLRRLEAGLFLLVESVLALSLCAVVWVGSDRVEEGRLTAGHLVLFISYLLHLYRPFTQFARQASQSGRTLACASRLLRLVEREPEVADRPGAVEAGALAGAVEFESVSVRAPKRRRGGRAEVLSDVSFRIEAGQRVAVVGPNGAGKSSVLRQVLRLADPDGGRVLVDGRDARDYALASLRGQMSAVYQEAALLGFSVADNIAIGRPGASREEIERAAGRSGLAELVAGLPDRYDTLVRRQGRLFSGGERQRLALARAVLRDGRVWLLDEPTGGLDAAASARLEETLLEATRGRTTLWVTHELGIAGKLDRVLFLEAGKVRFFGPPDEFERWFRAEVPLGDSGRRS